MTAPALQVTSTSGYMPGVGTVYFGLLRAGPGGREVWRCPHEHPERPGARSCARGELRQRQMIQTDLARQP
jgi:hypothetical protein